jgi:hypothetical protein
MKNPELDDHRTRMNNYPTYEPEYIPEIYTTTIYGNFFDKIISGKMQLIFRPIMINRCAAVEFVGKEKNDSIIVLDSKSIRKRIKGYQYKIWVDNCSFISIGFVKDIRISRHSCIIRWSVYDTILRLLEYAKNQ